MEETRTTESKMTPQEYFNTVKDRKNTITDEKLLAVYDNCLELLSKTKITGQKKQAAKILFHLECIEKEREIVRMGINTFVYRDDIEYYINKVADESVKIIELENFPREIPDEIVEVIEKVKDKFDKLYIVFTDYTGETEREVEEERKSKDPILFGTFQNEKSHSVIDRFYYLGDWEDEYCSLTLDKMVNETRELGNRRIEHTIKTPEDIKELKEQLGLLAENSVQNLTSATYIQIHSPKPKTFFEKVRTFFQRNPS